MYFKWTQNETTTSYSHPGSLSLTSYPTHSLSPCVHLLACACSRAFYFSFLFSEKGSTVSRLQSIACTPSLHLCLYTWCIAADKCMLPTPKHCTCAVTIQGSISLYRDWTQSCNVDTSLEAFLFTCLFSKNASSFQGMLCGIFSSRSSSTLSQQLLLPGFSPGFTSTRMKIQSVDVYWKQNGQTWWSRFHHHVMISWALSNVECSNSR